MNDVVRQVTSGDMGDHVEGVVTGDVHPLLGYPTYLPDQSSTYLPIYSPTDSHTYLHTHLFTYAYLPTHLSTHSSTYPPTHSTSSFLPSF